MPVVSGFRAPVTAALALRPGTAVGQFYCLLAPPRLFRHHSAASACHKGFATSALGLQAQEAPWRSQVPSSGTSKAFIESELRKLVKNELPKHLDEQLPDALAAFADELRQAMAAESAAASKPASGAGREAAEAAVEAALSKQLDAKLQAALAPLAEALWQATAHDVAEAVKATEAAGRAAAVAAAEAVVAEKSEEAASREAELISKTETLAAAAAQLTEHLRLSPALDAHVEKLVEARVAARLTPLLEEVKRLDMRLKQVFSEVVARKAGQTPQSEPLHSRSFGARTVCQILVSGLVIGALALVVADSISELPHPLLWKTSPSEQNTGIDVEGSSSEI